MWPTVAPTAVTPGQIARRHAVRQTFPSNVPLLFLILGAHDTRVDGQRGSANRGRLMPILVQRGASNVYCYRGLSVSLQKPRAAVHTVLCG